MLKLGAGYYAVMDCATSLRQLVARNERPLSQPGRFSALPWMTAEGQSSAFVDRRRSGRSAPFSDIPGIELEPRVRLEAATRVPAADRGPHAAGSNFCLVCYCYIIPSPSCPLDRATTDPPSFSARHSMPDTAARPPP